MTLATEIPSVFLFRPRSQEFCPTDDNGGEALYYFGEVSCPDCGRLVSVSAPLGEAESGYCWHGCETPITVMVDPQHIRMDNSRPRESEHGCICGDSRCRWWEVA